MAIPQPIDIFVGEAKTWLITITNRSNGDRFNLSAFFVVPNQLEFQVKLNDGDADPALISIGSFDSEFAILDQTIGGATEGQAKLTIPTVRTLLPFPGAGFYRWSLVMIQSGGIREVLIPPSDFTVNAVVNPHP